MHKAFLALLVSTGCAMMGDVPRMRFPQKRSNDISKVRETTNAEGFSCCFNEDCAARTVCSLTRASRLTYPRLGPCCQKTKEVSDSTTLAADSPWTLCCVSHVKSWEPSDPVRLQPDAHRSDCGLVLSGNKFLGCCYSCRNQTLCFPCREGGIGIASRILSQFKDLLGSVQCG
jgi:hypothetical protein